MKKLSSITVFLLATGFSLIVNAVYASDTPTPSSVTVAGSMQSEVGCPGDWQPDCTLTHLVFDANDNVWQNTFSIPAGNWEYKAALNDSWAENYGSGGVRNGANIPLSLAAPTAVKFYYDHETHWIADNANSVIVTAAGSFQSEMGCSGDWDPTCLRSWLQDPDGDGIYTFSTKLIPPGNYEVKATINESWSLNYGAGGVQNGPNIPFTVSPFTSETLFSYNAATHVLSVSTIEAPYAPILEQVSPVPTVYAPGSAGFFPMTYSGYGDVTAAIQPVANLGCDAADFAGFVPGRIALIKRGICHFSQKASNAVAVGAIGVIVYNAVPPDAFQGTLDGPGIGVPVVCTTLAIGQNLLNLALSGDVVVHMVVLPPILDQMAPLSKIYAAGSTGFFPLTYSGYGDVTAAIQPVANLGCDAADFAGFVPGRIALIKRGICHFSQKASNAVAVGAIGVIVYNAVPPDAFQGTLDGPGIGVPVVCTTLAIGEELLNLLQTQDVVVHMVVIPPVLDQVSPLSKIYAPNVPKGFFPLIYSGQGTVRATIQPAANLGCDAADFAGFVPGRIALIKRGYCTFFQKASNAVAVGAAGVIVYNSGQPNQTDAFQGTLSGPGISVPVIGTSYTIGQELLTLSLTQDVVVYLAVDTGVWTINKTANYLDLTLSIGQVMPVNYWVTTAVTSTGSYDNCVNLNDSTVGYLGQVCASDAPRTFIYTRAAGPYLACGEYTVQNTASFTTNDSATKGSSSWTIAVHVPCKVEIVCDVDKDGDIDQLDLALISRARGQTAPFGDLRDADGNGLITPNDVKVCIPRCTRPNCAVK